MKEITFKNRKVFNAKDFYESLARDFKSPLDAWNKKLKAEKEILQFQIDKDADIIKKMAHNLLVLIDYSKRKKAKTLNNSDEKNGLINDLQLHELILLFQFKGEKLLNDNVGPGIEILFQEAVDSANPVLYDILSLEHAGSTYPKYMEDVILLFDRCCEYHYTLQTIDTINTFKYLYDREEKTWSEQYKYFYYKKSYSKPLNDNNYEEIVKDYHNKTTVKYDIEVLRFIFTLRNENRELSNIAEVIRMIQNDDRSPQNLKDTPGSKTHEKRIRNAINHFDSQSKKRQSLDYTPK